MKPGQVGIPRRRLLGLLPAALPLVLGLPRSSATAEAVVIEDWSSSPLAVPGVPPGWRGQSWTRSTYDVAVEADGVERVLHLRSRNDATLITKALDGRVDLRRTPVLEWRWKAVVLPAGGDSRRRAADDQAVQVYVVWPRPPEFLRSHIIGYVWDTTAPVGTVTQSQSTRTVWYVVLRSGQAALGQWIMERRDVLEDYRRIYRGEPELPGAVALAVDSNDTRSVAESYVGTLRFVAVMGAGRGPVRVESATPGATRREGDGEG